MNNLEKELQIEILWRNYEYRKIDQKIGEMMVIFSQAANEIVVNTCLLDRALEFKAQQLTIELIWFLQDQARNTL